MGAGKVMSSDTTQAATLWPPVTDNLGNPADSFCACLIHVT